MVSSTQLFCFFCCILIIQLSRSFVINLGDATSSTDDESGFNTIPMSFSKRRLPMEGILMGKRASAIENFWGKYPFFRDGSSVGRRAFTIENNRAAKARYPSEGILIGK